MLLDDLQKFDQEEAFEENLKRTQKSVKEDKDVEKLTNNFKRITERMTSKMSQKDSVIYNDYFDQLFLTTG